MLWLVLASSGRKFRPYTQKSGLTFAFGTPAICCKTTSDGLLLENLKKTTYNFSSISIYMSK
jgi:hypothetical protein